MQPECSCDVDLDTLLWISKEMCEYVCVYGQGTCTSFDVFSTKNVNMLAVGVATFSQALITDPCEC